MLAATALAAGTAMKPNARSTAQERFPASQHEAALAGLAVK
jgi:hypothetical protein